jgi:hypothetical protein
MQAMAQSIRLARSAQRLRIPDPLLQRTSNSG